MPHLPHVRLRCQHICHLNVFFEAFVPRRTISRPCVVMTTFWAVLLPLAALSGPTQDQPSSVFAVRPGHVPSIRRVPEAPGLCAVSTSWSCLLAVFLLFFCCFLPVLHAAFAATGSNDLDHARARCLDLSSLGCRQSESVKEFNACTVACLAWAQESQVSALADGNCRCSWHPPRPRPTSSNFKMLLFFSPQKVDDPCPEAFQSGYGESVGGTGESAGLLPKWPLIGGFSGQAGYGPPEEKRAPNDARDALQKRRPR